MAETPKTMNISLPPQLYAFVEDELAAGEYPSASAVLQDALRLLQKEKELYRIKTERLRAEIEIGLAAMDAGDTMSWEEFKAEMDAKRASGSGGRESDSDES